MARVESSVVNGHRHKYTDQVGINTSGANRTSISDGHSHLIIRDGAGRAIRIERADGHTHELM